MANMTNSHSHNPVGRTISAYVALGDEHAQIRFEPVLYDPNLLRSAGALSRVPIIAPDVDRDDKTGEVRRQRRDHLSMPTMRSRNVAIGRVKCAIHAALRGVS